MWLFQAALGDQGLWANLRRQQEQSLPVFCEKAMKWSREGEHTPTACKRPLTFRTGRRFYAVVRTSPSSAAPGYGAGKRPPNKPDSPLLSWRLAERRFVSKALSSPRVIHSPESRALCVGIFCHFSSFPPSSAAAKEQSSICWFALSAKGGGFGHCSDPPPYPETL